MDKILTISIAAYNVEKYLEQTLSSLSDSRFIDDIEVLIIDDGSKDRTRDIALKYQEMAPDSFRYVPKENGGHGSTINKGIELAQGKYFRAIDGDDWVDKDAFTDFICRLKSEDADMILTQHKTVCGSEEKLIKFVRNMEDGKKYSWIDELDIEYVTIHMMTLKTELLQKNNVRITEKCFYVDIEFIVWAIYLSESIVYWELPVYMYRIGNANQSINKKNMLKNVGMQETVSYKLAAIFDRFRESGRLSKTKEDVIFRRITRSIGSTVRTYLLIDNGTESKEKIILFDKKIREISENTYAKLGRSQFFKAVRCGNYALVPVIRAIYKIWCMKYK